MKRLITTDWQEILQAQFDAPYYQDLRRFLVDEYKQYLVYPNMNQIWTAFELTPYKEVKVVILGQDPYHGPNQAHGLSFSVQDGIKLPPSLVNIYKELEDDLGVKVPLSGNLTSWAKQGVLLLNTVLTVRGGLANSHRNQGWEKLTDAAIQALNERPEPVVFILWGNPSIKKRQLIDQSRHVVLTSPHPSPLSAYRGFFGSKPFSKANAALIEMGQTPINWEL